MKKLTDVEFEMIRRTLGHAERRLPAATVNGLKKLISNYQEQLEAESYVAAERYTDANCEPTVKCVDLREMCPVTQGVDTRGMSADDLDALGIVPPEAHDCTVCRGLR